MSKKISQITDVIQLRNSASALTAASTQSAELSNARLKGFKGGVAVLTIMAINASGTETYSIAIQSRTPAGTGSYTTINTFSFSTAAGTSLTGTYLLDLDTLGDGLSYLATFANTPSMTFNLHIVVPSDAAAAQYQPSPGTAITT